MNFKPAHRAEPEINLIPFIDVLLVILIFLMLTTTYSRYQELELTLPVANAEQALDRPGEINVSITSDGRYAVNGQLLAQPTVASLAAQMASAAPGPDSILIISADAMAPHQTVVTVMEAARNAGLAKVTFATQATSQ